MPSQVPPHTVIRTEFSIFKKFQVKSNPKILFMWIENPPFVVDSNVTLEEPLKVFTVLSRVVGFFMTIKPLSLAVLRLFWGSATTTLNSELSAWMIARQTPSAKGGIKFACYLF